MTRLMKNEGKVPLSVWFKAVCQWLSVCLTYGIGWILTFFPMGLIVAATSKKQLQHPQGKPLVAEHSSQYVSQGSSGSWEYWNSDVPFVKWWNNYEDGTLGEPSGKNSARVGGKERSFWSQYKWSCRNPFNWAKRTNPKYHCLVDNCTIEYWGEFELSDKVIDKQGWQFVVATDMTSGKKYYAYRKVAILDDKEHVRHTRVGFKIDPDHALHTQDADDKDKAFTIRIPVKQTID